MRKMTSIIYYIIYNYVNMYYIKTNIFIYKTNKIIYYNYIKIIFILTLYI